MKKSIKNKILMSLVVLFTITMALVGVFNIKPNAVADATFAGQDTLIRVENPEEGGRKGIRFTSNVSKSILDEYAGYTLSYGTFIMPAHYLADEFHGEINEDSVFGENPKYIFDKSEDSSLDEATRPWKILHVSGALTEIDAETYAIKASVNMNVVNNWNIKYVAKAYIKAEKEGETTKYVFADSAASQSMLDAVVVKMDDKNVQDDAEMMGILNGFIDDYEAAGKNVTVNYQVVKKYAGANDEIEVANATARIGSVLNVDAYREPDNDTAAVLNKDYRYYYLANQDLGSLRVKADGSTKIVVSFDAKQVYSNVSDVATLPLKKLNAEGTGNEPYADSYDVALSGEKVVNLTYAEVSALKKGTQHRIQQFLDNEPVVNEIYVRPVTAILNTMQDVKNMPKLGQNEEYTFGNGEYFVIGSDIDMTGYYRGWVSGTSYAGSSAYTTHGFRGELNGDGHVLYNLKSTLIDIIGYSSKVSNLTVIGTALTTPDKAQLSLISRANYGEIINCRFEITVPENATKYTPNYDWTGLVFDHSYAYDVNGVANTVYPRVSNSVIRIKGTNTMNSTVFGRCETAKFTNVHVFTDNPNVFAEGKAPAEEYMPAIYGVNETFAGNEYFDSKWSFDADIPYFSGKKIVNAYSSYAGYVLNESKTDRVANPDDITKSFGENEYTLSSEIAETLISDKSSYVIKDGDFFANFVVDKVTALISTADDLENILYLAGGANPSSVTINGTAGYHKFGAGEKYVLTNNIDMSGRTPALDTTKGSGGLWGAGGFHGTIDGNGYTVTNLTNPLFALIGSDGVIKNTSFVSDYVGANFFVEYTYGTVDNCYFDITTSTQSAKLFASYAYGSKWTNNVIKINSLSTVTNYINKIANAFMCDNVQSWNMTNSIVMTNAPAWYSTAGTEGLRPAPTTIGLDGLTTGLISEFMANGGNSDVWTEDLTFKNFTINEDSEETNLWAKYVYADETCASRVANEEDYVKGSITIPSATLSALTEGSFYSVASASKDSYERSIVHVVTGIANNQKEFAKFRNLCGGDGSRNPYNGYIVLGANVVMSDTFALGNNPSSGSHFNDSAFNGVIDGMGHTVEDIKSRLFYSFGGAYGATMKNIKFVNATKIIAVTMGSVTFDNCEFEFRMSAMEVQYTTNLVGVLATKIDKNRNVVIKDTEIKIQNLTENKYYIVEQLLDNSTITFDNSTLYAQEEIIGALGFENASLPTIDTRDIGYHYYAESETFYYGRYAFDPSIKEVTYAKETDVPVAVANTFDLKGVFKSNGQSFTLSNVNSLIGISNPETEISYSFGVHKSDYLVKDSIGSYHRINIAGCRFVVYDKFDLQYVLRGLRYDNWQNVHEICTVGFNADIDMTGVVSTTNAAANAGTYGMRGIIEGNGRVISNLDTTLIGRMNNVGTMRNLVFKDMKANGTLTLRSSGGTYENVKFDIDATGLSKLYLINKSDYSRTVVNVNNCEIVIKNASDSFVCYLDYGPHPNYDKGTLNVTNLAVNMNAGSFRISAAETTEADLVGPIDTVIESFTITKVA